MQTIDIKPIDVSSVKKAETETGLIVEEAKGLKIVTQADFIKAGDLRKKIKGKIKELNDTRKALTAPLDLVKKNIMGLFSPVIDRLTRTVEVIDAGTIAYSEEQERKAREAQAKADEQARKEREKAEARAKELLAKGKEEKAQQMQEKAESIVAPIIESAAPKIAGQSIREIWYAKVIDFKALTDDYKIADQSKLDKVAMATKGTIQIPGVRFYSKKIVSGRRE